jgi:hypothetical protein
MKRSRLSVLGCGEAARVCNLGTSLFGSRRLTLGERDSIIRVSDKLCACARIDGEPHSVALIILGD